jgi:hypothetical protein
MTTSPLCLEQELYELQLIRIIKGWVTDRELLNFWSGKDKKVMLILFVKVKFCVGGKVILNELFCVKTVGITKWRSPALMTPVITTTLDKLKQYLKMRLDFLNQ